MRECPKMPRTLARALKGKMCAKPARNLHDRNMNAAPASGSGWKMKKNWNEPLAWRTLAPVRRAAFAFVAAGAFPPDTGARQNGGESRSRKSRNPRGANRNTIKVHLRKRASDNHPAQVGLQHP
jgi:hypothetical protein